MSDSMRKNFLYAGLLLIALGLILVVFVFPSAVPSNLVTPISRQLVLSPGSSGYVQISLNTSGIIEAIFNSTVPLDFYFTNSSAFGAAYNNGIANDSVRGLAAVLQGKGVYEVYKSASNGAFPFKFANVTVADYLQNVTVLGNGTYYAVFSNNNNASAAINLMYASASSESLRSTFNTLGMYGLAAIVVFLAGLGLAVASFLMKEKPKPQNSVQMDEDAKKMYDSIEKKR
jgi:hypothetical protein